MFVVLNVNLAHEATMPDDADDNEKAHRFRWKEEIIYARRTVLGWDKFIVHSFVRPFADLLPWHFAHSRRYKTDSN